jgi:CheY-like chemotaxis protein
VDIERGPSKSEFKQAVRGALMGLYDPGVLAASPLITWLGLHNENDPARALLDALLQAIESRRPGPDVPPQSNAWRIYHILRQRYVECFGQRDIAATLVISTRQLRRLHVLALDVLGDYLFAHYHLDGIASARAAALASTAPASVSQDTSPDAQEMEVLGATPFEPADAGEILQIALRLLAPIVQGNRVTLTVAFPENVPNVAVQRVPLRHAFLSILTTLLRSAAGGQITIGATSQPGQARFSFSVQPAGEDGLSVQIVNEQIATARRLLQLSNGDLAITQDQDGGALLTVILPTVAGVPVVIVDDNVDALRLFQRYLDGTRYRFIGTADPQYVLEMAEEAAASIVVLDLMLPRVDGWELLARLREHPRTRHIPVIICTILPEEDLALMFGAAALLRKPVSQPELLAALDRALAQPRESR